MSNDCSVSHRMDAHIDRSRKLTENHHRDFRNAGRLCEWGTTSMAKGHVYHHKAGEAGCAKRGCGLILMLLLIAFAIRGCFAFIENKAPAPPAAERRD
jgi:hypothetical protein